MLYSHKDNSNASNGTSLWPRLNKIMTNILLVHPEGNINNNPNLFAIVELLCGNGYYVDYLVKKNPIIDQRSYIKNLQILFLDDTNIDDVEQLDNKKYSLIIGIDNGIVIASKIARKLNIPYCYISYEIMFADELGKVKKNHEIAACKNISFAICQDPVRSYFLSIENNISVNKILNIPVTGNYQKRHPKSDFLYERLSIPKDKKIALFAGSISKWSMIGDIVKQTDFWPKNWVLVLHDRYGRNLGFLSSLIKNRPQIYISDKPLKTPDDLEKLICSADVGIGLYQSNFKSAYEGKNLVFLGLSTGKLITYLKYGLPVITNEIGQMSDYIRQYKLGQVVRDVNEINPEPVLNIPNCSENCIRFFKEKLDFRLKSDQLLKLIDDAIHRKIDYEQIQKLNEDLNYPFSKSQIEQTKYYFNLAKDFEKSRYYRLGRRIYHPHFLFSESKKNLKVLVKKLINKKDKNNNCKTHNS